MSYPDQFNVLAKPLHPVDWQILKLITGSFEHRPWALQEIYNQIDADKLTISQGLTRLCDVRLILSFEGTYFIPARAAVYYNRLSTLAQDPPRSPRPSYCARRWCEDAS